jgi:hypothetical protein
MKGSVQSAVQLTIAVVAAVIAFLGMLLFAYVVIARALSPDQRIFSRALHLDVSQTNLNLVGQTAFIPTNGLLDGLVPADLPPDTRFLPSKSVVDVWVELQLPGSVNGGSVVQVPLLGRGAGACMHAHMCAA